MARKKSWASDVDGLSLRLILNNVLTNKNKQTKQFATYIYQQTDGFKKNEKNFPGNWIEWGVCYKNPIFCVCGPAGVYRGPG